MQRQIWRHNPHVIPQPPVPPTVSLPFRVSLEIVRGQAKQRLRPVLNPTFLIGTADDCDLVLGDPQFPEVHAYIRISNEGVSLRHLGFAPPITINGRTATQQPLADGDRLRTGPFEFVVHLQPGEVDDDDTVGHRSLGLPAAMDRVEDAVGNALVQQLLAQIRSEILPGLTHLKLFDDRESSGHESGGSEQNSLEPTSEEPNHSQDHFAPQAHRLEDRRNVFARSS
jgi:predicted component of type VI protein secretion system